MTTVRTDARLDAGFSKLDLAGRGAVIAAVSGGSDSTALLFLFKTHVERVAPGTRLIAVTIDHGLRPGSAAEAASVGRLCADHGIDHRTLCWSGAKPRTGLPAAAREARYRLLAQAAETVGTDIVVVGHTRDDQAETISMRRLRGAGPGLAGMAPATLYDGKVWILRPLLETSRMALRDFLRGIGVGWIDDPTNQNMAFERARLRAAGSGNADDPVPATAARIKQAGRAADLIAAHASRASPGLIRLDRRFVATGDRAAAIQALRVLLAVSGGAEHLPDLARTAALFDRLGEGPLCATLSRTVVDARRAAVFFHRELRDLPAPLPPRNGMVWDGRFRIAAAGGRDGLAIAPLGQAQARRLDLPETEAPRSLMRAALAAWPAIFPREELREIAATPLRGEGQSEAAPAACPLAAAKENDARMLPAALPLLAPWARFMPCFDHATAGAVAELIGAPSIPLPPCEGHKDARA